MNKYEHQLNDTAGLLQDGWGIDEGLGPLVVAGYLEAGAAEIARLEAELARVKALIAEQRDAMLTTWTHFENRPTFIADCAPLWAELEN